MSIPCVSAHPHHTLLEMWLLWLLSRVEQREISLASNFLSLDIIVSFSFVLFGIEQVSSQGTFKLPCSMEDFLLLSLTVQCIIIVSQERCQTAYPIL